MGLIENGMVGFENLVQPKETQKFGDHVSRLPEYGNSVSGYALDDGEMLELSVFLKTILEIEAGTRMPRCRAERRMDAVIHDQAAPQSFIEVLFKRWCRAGRPSHGIRMCDQAVTEGDWANFDYPKAHRYGQRSNTPPQVRFG